MHPIARHPAFAGIGAGLAGCDLLNPYPVPVLVPAPAAIVLAVRITNVRGRRVIPGMRRL